MNDDHARPIPQGKRPTAPADDDVYVVDTRRRARPVPPPGSHAQPSSRPTARPASAGAPPPAAAAPPAPAPATVYDELGRPVPTGSGAPPAPPRTPRPTGTPRRPRPGRGRRIGRIALTALLAWLTFVIVTPIHAWSQVAREDTTPSTDRPQDASGSTYLLVGSDSREGLSAQEREDLGIGGNAEGRRTDSIILVHTPSGSGKPVLISIPRQLPADSR